MRKLIIIFAVVCGYVMAQADEINAVKFVQNETTDWYLLASNPEVTFTNGNPVINGKTYDLALGVVETEFGTAPIDEWVTVRENMTVNDYGTLCWQYNLTAIEGAELYTIAGREGDRIVFEEVKAEETQAGAGYVILVTAETLRVKNGTNSIATPLTAAECNGLQGTFVDITDGAAGTAGNILEGNYIVYNNQWRKCGGYTGLKANRAYLILDNIPNKAPLQAPNRKYISMPLPNETPTGLESVHDSQCSMHNGKYLINGQFMIMRDNKMYNAQGQEVK